MAIEIDPGNRAAFIAAIRARVARAAQGGDVSAVLNAEALAEARGLAVFAEGDDPEPAYVLGNFHLVRYQLLPPGEDEDDFAAAVRSLGLLFPRRPDLVPAPLLSEVGRVAPFAGNDAAGWHDEALRLLGDSQAGHNLVVLNRVVGLLERTVGSVTGEDPEFCNYQANLCLALTRRFGHTASAGDIDRAVTAGRRAVADARSGSPWRAGYHDTLGRALQARFEVTGVLAAINEAVAAGRVAVELTRPGDEDREMFLDGLGVALALRFGHTGTRTDGEEAIRVFESALAVTPAGDPDRARYLSHLATVLEVRFGCLGHLADLDRAVDVFREALDAADVEDPDGSTYLHGWSLAVRMRGEATGSLDDVEQAITAARGAVDGTPEGHPDQAIFLSGLASAWHARFDQTGRRTDIDEAIKVGERAVAVPAGAVDRALYLNNLSNAVIARGERYGILEDLDRGLDLGSAAVATIPAGHAVQVTYLANLANKQLIRFRRTGLEPDLDKAVSNAEEASALVPADDVLYGIIWSNLAVMFRTRYARRREADDLERAIAAGRLAIETLPSDHPRRVGALSELGLNLLNRFEITGSQADLNEATHIAGQAVASRATGPSHAMHLFNLGTVLSRRPGDPAAEQRAAEVLSEAARSAAAAPLVRVESGKLWAALASAASDHPRAEAAWREVFGQLPLLTGRSLARADQEHHLRAMTGIASGAAATALGLRDPQSAWLRLEQGRGVLLGQELRTRTDLDVLGQQHPALAAEVDRVHALLRREPVPDEPGRPTTGSGPVRRRALQEWRRVLDDIHQHAGFERFGLPPTIEELRDAIDEGDTVVALNAAPSRCDALLLTRHGQDHVALPEVSFEQAARHASAFLARVHIAPEDGTQEDLLEVLAWLWDVVAAPVLEHLGYATPLDPGIGGRRVWWIPTGPLSALPVHAAGHHLAGTDTVLDRVVSSYTPTVQALRHSRRQSRRQHGSAGGMLAVGIEEAGGLPRLAKAAEEAALVADLHGGLPLLNAQATRAAVTKALPSARWAHFACHADAKEDDPSASCLYLADGPLQVREIMGLMPASGGHLAYLSACSTAYGGTGLLDEAIHIASAFQLAGFHHVVATLWPVADQAALERGQQIHDRLKRGVDPALAVHHAVHASRSNRPGSPSVWASHVHFGA
jgi:tetratricopeptide (TPR) repeat protein